ncbi:hypothetical protein [Flavobacterium sp. JAS]|uniref:hypothetical protein n=1 Tax=Flavobacterium sp. JAS TaxID=2897329 RepID=UPI001E364EA3|nr:hypothetical protein [Flavobacterium sp. JAS]MCD0469758.1 hypothetical protein [Flavobacterium sp. JAS]
MKKYELYWNETSIGSLTETNWDMRSSGDVIYKFDFLTESPENVHLANFIKHSIKASNYLEEGDEENYNKMCEEANTFLDLIYSPDWYLVNEKNEILKILCPIFHKNNEITWQIDIQ